MSAKPRKTAAKKVAAKDAVKRTGRKAETAAGSVGPSLIRDTSEPGKRKPSRSVSERSDTLTAKPPRPLTEVSGHSEAAPNLYIVNKPESLAARLDDILKTGGSSSSRMYAAGLGAIPQRDRPLGWRIPKPTAHLLPGSEANATKNVGEASKEVETAPPPDGDGRLLPLDPQWREMLRRLLEEPEFDPRGQIGEVLKKDVIGILAHMPFELRKQAQVLIRKGWRVFGKVPCIPARIDSEGRSVARVITGCPRPISCPEPAGDGQEFALAWLDGDFWEYEYDEIGERLDAIDDLINTGLRCHREFLTKVGMRMAARRARGIEGDIRNFSLAALDAFLSDLGGMDDAELRRQVRAFRAGATFSSQVQYSQSTKLYNEWMLIRTPGWPSILAHALSRHGLGTDRKTLLARLGCLNTEEFRKTSKVPLLFSWRFTPPITGINFDKYFGEELKLARQLDSFHQGRSDSSKDDVVQPVVEKIMRNARYGRRVAKRKTNEEDLAQRKKADRDKVAADAKQALASNEQRVQAEATRAQNARVEEAKDRKKP